MTHDDDNLLPITVAEFKKQDTYISELRIEIAKQGDTIQELRKQLSEQQRREPTIEDMERQNDTIQSLRDALNKEQAKLTALQASFTFIEADRDAQEACSLRLRSELAQADRERGELRQDVRRQERAISDLQMQLNIAKDSYTVLQVQNANLRELQEKKIVNEVNKPEPITHIPGLQYAVREVEEEKEFDDEVSLDDLKHARPHMDLTTEIRRLTAERDAIKAERDALLAKNRERADRSGEAYAKPIDFTGLRDAVARLRTHTHGGWSPDFREDTTTPASDPDQDPEVLVISEVLPCISDLDIQARRRVLRYLTDRLVNDWVVGDAL